MEFDNPKEIGLFVLIRNQVSFHLVIKTGSDKIFHFDQLIHFPSVFFVSKNHEKHEKLRSELLN
jgi:hypothetical protein